MTSKSSLRKALVPVIGCLILIIGPLAAATPLTQEEDHLRARIRAYYGAFEKGDLDAMIALDSQKTKTNPHISSEEQEKVKLEFHYFVTHENPRGRVKSISIEGKRAIVKMDVSVQLPDGSREHGEVFDLWVHENGKWYLRDASRTSPEYFPRD